MFARLKEIRKEESGMTIAEILVAFVLITGALTGIAVFMTEHFRIMAATEVKEVAVAISQDEIDKAQSKDFLNLYLVKTNDVTIPDSYNNEPTAVRVVNQPVWSASLETSGFQYQKNIVTKGTTYNVKTYVTQPTQTTMDGAGQHIQTTPTVINGTQTVAPVFKRVTVVVSWTHEGDTFQTSKTWQRFSSPAVCIPPRLQTGGSAGNDKWDAQPRIQACEGRK